MKRWMLVGWLALLLSGTAETAESPAILTGTSVPGGLRVTLESRLVPLTVNQMHSWVISVRDPSGNPVTAATITVDGGMPLHNHGLPTRPEVTRHLGNGDYLLEGMRFHMHGLWEIRLEIHAGTSTDTLRLELEV